MNNFNIKYESGIDFEKAVALFIKQKLGLRCSHNDFNPSKYAFDHHNTVDIVVEEKILIECTNPKESTSMNDTIMDSKIEYFHRQDPKHNMLWVMVVSFLVFSKEMKAKIRSEGIHLVPIYVHAEKENLHKTIRALFESALFKLLKPFSKKYRVNNKLIDSHAHEVLDNEKLNIISTGSRVYINDGKNPKIEYNATSKKSANKIIDSVIHLWQHQETRKDLQTLRRIVFLLKINELS